MRKRKEALLSHGGIEGVRVVALERLEGHCTIEKQPKIPGIAKLNNFRFVDGQLAAWCR